MAYRTSYEAIERTDFRSAWEQAKELDPELRKSDPDDPNALRAAVVAMSKRVQELEWS
jgi:hypothetical protein